MRLHPKTQKALSVAYLRHWQTDGKLLRMTVPESTIGKRVVVAGRKEVGVIVNTGANVGRPGQDFPMMIRFETGEYVYYDPEFVTVLS